MENLRGKILFWLCYLSLVYQTWRSWYFGVSFCSSKKTQPTSSVFDLFRHFMLAVEKDWGERNNIMHRGTPAQFFFHCFNLDNFKQIVFRVALLKFV